MRISDWSSDVCSSDLCCRIRRPPPHAPRVRAPTGIPRRLDRDPVPWQARRRRPPVQGARQQHGGSLYDLARTPHPANGTPYMTDSPLPHALALAARGYPVFPVIEDGKLPAIKGWRTRATTDEATIRQW